MTDQECIEWYQALAEMMGKSHLKWVVDAIEEEIREGDTISYEEVEEPLHQLPLFSGKPSSQAEYADIEEDYAAEKFYSPKKRLLMLIDAFEHAIVNIAEMKDYVASYLAKQHSISKIVFMSPDNRQESFVLNQQEARTRLVAARKLRGLLDELRREIHQSKSS